MKKNLFSTAALGLMLAATDVSAYTDINPTESYNMVVAGQGYIIDVRTFEEFVWVGHPGKNKAGDGAALEGKVVNESWMKYGKGDVLVINPSFVSDMEELFPDKTTPIIMMCRSGVRSIAAALALEDAGYTTVYNMLQGFEGETDANGYRTVNGWKKTLPYNFSNVGVYGD
jgi:rhodanese-related sulfurtransferase